MPTFNYKGKAPITSVRAELLGGHYHVDIWVNHAKAGEICLREAEFLPFLKLVAIPIPVEEDPINGTR